MPDIHANEVPNNPARIRRELENAIARQGFLTDVLGTQSLTNGEGSLRTSISGYEQSPVSFGTISSLNGQYVGLNVDGYESLTVEVSGTWVGTLSFEGIGIGGSWALVSASNLNTGVASYATANGIYRLNVAGLTRIRASFSAYTSGSASVMLRASTAPSVASFTSISNVVTVSGSGTFTTSDTTWASLWGASGSSPSALNYAALVRPGIEPAPIVPVSPIQNTTYVNPYFAKFPQIYSRLRVEAGGSEKLPFAQDQLTNQLIVTDDLQYPILEAILLQLRALNEIMIQFTNVSPPSWWDTTNDGFKFQ